MKELGSKLKLDECFEVEEALLALKEKGTTPELEKIEAFLTPIFENEKAKEFKRQRDIKWSWQKFYPRIEMSRVLSALTSSNTLLEEAINEVKKLDEETQDILHALEFQIFDSEEDRVKLTDDLVKIRQLRRVAKNFIELITPVAELANKHKGFVKELGKVKCHLDDTFNTLEARRYHPRIRHELKADFMQVQK